MEFVIVTFPSRRQVFLDGQPFGQTNARLTVQAGFHNFDLGFPIDYAPPLQTVNVVNTTAANPLPVVFQALPVAIPAPPPPPPPPAPRAARPGRRAKRKVAKKKNARPTKHARSVNKKSSGATKRSGSKKKRATRTVQTRGKVKTARKRKRSSK